MTTIPLSQAMYMAGVYWTDSEFERELKFIQWIADRKYIISRGYVEVADREVDVLIFEE
jgi:hypothetical protein